MIEKGCVPTQGNLQNIPTRFIRYCGVALLEVGFILISDSFLDYCIRLHSWRGCVLVPALYLFFQKIRCAFFESRHKCRDRTKCSAEEGTQPRRLWRRIRQL